VLTALLSYHALTGCDTACGLYRQGKKKALRLLQKREDLCRSLEVFCHDNASVQSLIEASTSFLLALYDCPATVTSLDEFRYHSYIRAVSRCPIQNEIQLAALPPTNDAAKHHILRSYHQVQL